MTDEQREAREIQAAADMEKAKAGFGAIKRVLKWLAILLLLSFAYTTGESAGVAACATFKESSL